jgi:hypothetical protein
VLDLARPNISRLTIKQLYSKSGNQCAYPDCVAKNFDDQGKNMSSIAHISAISPGGPRYDSNLTIEDRNDISNLLILCYKHHREIDHDNPDNYSIEVLKKMKTDHESTVEQIFDLPDNELENIIKKLENELNEKIEQVEGTMQLLENAKEKTEEYKDHCDTFLRGFIDVLSEFIPMQLPGN